VILRSPALADVDAVVALINRASQERRWGILEKTP
jgi:hypothetical protein